MNRTWLGVWLTAIVLPLLAACASSGGAGSQTDSGANPVAQAPLPDSAEESDERRRARIRLELAGGYYQQGNYSVALDELRQALQVDPNYAPAFGLLGLVYMDMGERTRAEESFQRGLRLAPNDSDLLNNYGWFLCQTGRERDSIDLFVRALRNPLYRTPAKPLHNAGICSLKFGDEQRAEGYFQQAFRVEPSNPVAMFNLSELYLKRNDVERARFYSQRLMSAFEPNAQTLWLAIRIERKAGNRDREAQLSSQLRRRFPSSPEAVQMATGR